MVRFYQVKLISLLLLLALSGGGYSQFYKPTSISLKTRGGYLIAHRAVMSHLIQQNNYGFELEFSKQRKDKTEWESLSKPVSGVSLIYQDFGYKAVLGQAIGLFQHYSQPIIVNKKFGFLDFRIGTGLALVTKKYDPIDNPKNNAIGSIFNSIVDLQLSYKKHFKLFHIGMGMGITHYSNAALFQPNLGLNTPYIDFCVGTNFEEREVFRDSSTGDGESRKLKSTLGFTGIGGSRQNLAGNELPKSYPLLSIQSYYSFALGSKWKLDVGLDLFYNEANRQLFPEDNYTIGETVQLGFFSGSTVRLYRTEIYINFGYYLVDMIKPTGNSINMYNRIGYRYLINKQLYALIGIKAHYGKADYIEFGLGVRFFDEDINKGSIE